MIEQLMQLTIDNAFVCEVFYDDIKKEFLYSWAQDCFVEDLMVDYKKGETLFEWIHNIQTNSNIIINNYKIETILDYGKDISTEVDPVLFLNENKMIDLVSTNQVKGFIISLYTF